MLACARGVSRRCVAIPSVSLALVCAPRCRSELSPLPGEALAGIPVTNTSWRHGSVGNLFQTRFEVLSVLRMQISFLETGAAGRLLSAGKCF